VLEFSIKSVKRPRDRKRIDKQQMNLLFMLWRGCAKGNVYGCSDREIDLGNIEISNETKLGKKIDETQTMEIMF